MRGYQIFDLVVVVLVVGLLGLALAHRWHSRLRKIWRTYRTWLGFLIPVLAVFVLAVGILSVEKEPASKDDPAAMEIVDQTTIVKRQPDDFSGVMNAVRLLKLDPAESTPGFWGHVGRGAAVLLWVMLGLELNRVLLYTAIQAGQLRQEMRHTIVCGLGSIGLQVVKDLHRLGKRTVVIESNAANPHLDDARELGALVLIRDATDDETMKMVHPERASELFALTGTDASNSAVIAQAARTLRERPRRKVFGPLRCFASIESGELADAANQLDFGRDLEDFEVDFVLPAEFAATQLLCGPVLKRLPESMSGRSLHFVLFGFGMQGQALAKQIANLVHLEDEKRTRVTILFEDARSVARFQSEYPAFCPDLKVYRAGNPDKWDLPAEADEWDGPYHAAKHLRSPVDEPGVSFVCNAAFIPMPEDPVADGVLRGIDSLNHRDDCLPMVVICTDDENRNARIAQRLRDRLATTDSFPSDHPWYGKGLPVFVSLPTHTVLHDALTDSNEASDADAKTCVLIPYARTNQILSYDAIARSGQRAVAKAIYHGYFPSPKPSPDVLWSRLASWERHSNLAAAGHAPFKGRMIGLPLDLSKVLDDGQIVQQSSLRPVSVSQENVELIGRVEHNRWLAERLMSGWRYAPLPPHDNTPESRAEVRASVKKERSARRERDQIVPNERLPAEEFSKDLIQQDSMLSVFGYTARGT